MKKTSIVLPKSPKARNLLATAPLLSKGGVHQKDTKKAKAKNQRRQSKKTCLDY